jgi:hypothetical protein
MRNTTLINNVSYAFWQRQSRNEMIRIGLKILIFIGAMVLARTANAQITVDGNPSDWPAVFSDPTIPFKTKIVDAVNTNDDVFTGGGSKDDGPISGWQWITQSTNDKSDMENVGLALIGHKLYFFADRYSQKGDANCGLWVFKNNVHKLGTTSGGFSSEHTTGDLFITMAFTGGGGHPERHVYKWIVPTGLVEVTLSTAAADVASNQSSVYPAPTPTWSFVSKDTAAANVYPRNGFLEGFVDIDSLGFGVDICFSEFFVDTRTSASTSSVLMDLASGTFATRPLVTVANDTVCSGQPAIFTAVVTGGLPPITFSWNGTAYGASNTFTVNPATVNTVVTVLAQGNNGCISEPDTAQLVVKPSPTVTATPDRTHCNGATGSAITFSSTPAGASFSWVGTRNVGFGTSGTVNPIPSYTATNTSSVTVD